MYRKGDLFFQSELPERVAWRLGQLENKDGKEAQYNQSSTTSHVISLHRRYVESGSPKAVMGNKPQGKIDLYDSFLRDVAGNLMCDISQLKSGAYKVIAQVGSCYLGQCPSCPYIAKDTLPWLLDMFFFDIPGSARVWLPLFLIASNPTLPF